MHKRMLMLSIIVSMLCISQFGFAQITSSSGLDKFLTLSEKLLYSLEEKQQHYSSKLNKQTDRYFNKLIRQENRIKRRLIKKDSVLANELALGNDSLYAHFRAAVANDSNNREIIPKWYSGSIDSMTMALKFMNQQGIMQLPLNKYNNLFYQYGNLNSQLTKAEYLKNQVNNRKAFLREKLMNLGLGKEFTRYQKKVFYYQNQLNEYKKAIENPSIIERKTLEILSEVPAFRKYFDKFSELGTMFRLPGQMEDLDPAATIGGLQTRESVEALLNTRFGSSSNAQHTVTNGLEQGREQLKLLKSKLSNTLNSSEVVDMPGFKPNHQKTKSFLKRLEVGTNFQSTRANNYYPVTTDFGLGVSYKFNNYLNAGIGSSYKIGWGESIRKIRITSEGISFRTFIEAKAIGGFWLAGGAEWNFRNRFDDLMILKTINQWQQSALLGIEKKYRIGKRISTASLLYNFLWNQQMPQEQPIIFRVGYQLK